MYLKALHTIRSSNEGQAETSYYTPLANLLNSVGDGLAPRVHCVMQLRDRGADHPDGGLFTDDQLQQTHDFETLLAAQSPARGVIEVKPLGRSATTTRHSAQVKKYWLKYGLVLVTNYRDFQLVGRAADGTMEPGESFSLAVSEEEFWALSAHPRAAAQRSGESFLEYLRRALHHDAPITAPSEVAALLAAYARTARTRLEAGGANHIGTIRQALEQALGLTFEGEKGEAFFRSTLVQTLFYGVFSAFVLWGRETLGRPAGRFEWGMSARYLKVPVIRKLFHEVADPGPLDEAGITETLGWAERALNRVVLNAFFERFADADAIQYFYEPFLEAFDPQLRKELGVWYTPHEIVRYQVARVDEALRTELGVEGGLASPDVYVLDPCCGTGAYLVEALRVISDRLNTAGHGALASAQVKQAACTRVFGFEIMPAPYVVAHLQLGLLLQELGAPLTGAGERAAVYLTNALTGWEPPQGPKQHLLFSEFEEERDAAERVKRDDPILVILGNPPYNGFAGVSPAEEGGLVEPYKAALRERGMTKNYLDDLYVRFFRIAERRIVERSGRGVICYISNYSWLTEPSFVGMRERFLSEFDSIWLDNLNGDSRETGKLSPDGAPDPSIFSTANNREGIRVGTAIALLVKKGESDAEGGDTAHATIRYRQFWGATKAQQLLDALGAPDVPSYEQIHPAPSNHFLLRPWRVEAGYDDWPSVTDLSAVKPLLGLNDNRAQATQDTNRAVLTARMQAYYNAAVNFEALGEWHKGLVSDAASFDASKTRARLVRDSRFDAENITRFWFRPFDLRWAYIERAANLWNRVRPDLLYQKWSGNEFLLVRNNAPKTPDGAAFFWSHEIGDQHVLHKDAYFIPVRLRGTGAVSDRPLDPTQGDLLAGNTTVTTANLSNVAREYLAALGALDPDVDVDTAALVWQHVLAMGYSPLYLHENASGVRHGWARVPLPGSLRALQASADLGRALAEYLDPAVVLPGVTRPPLRPFIASVAVAHTERGVIAPADLSAMGWGFASKGGIVMPGRGDVRERDFTLDELALIEREAARHHLLATALVGALGPRTVDIHLNDIVVWRNIPERVWNYAVGGFQVLKKWLSYRDESLIGRPLTLDEAIEFTTMARRLTAIVLMEPLLDTNYITTRDATFRWTESEADDVTALGAEGDLGEV